MEFRVLGSLEVVDHDGPVALGGPKQRAVLALLLLHRGEPVSTDRLIDELGLEPGRALRELEELRLHWSAGRAGVPRGPSYVIGLSCPSATECFVQGQYQPGGLGMFVMHPDGSGLTYVTRGYAAFGHGIVCSSRANCYVFASNGANPDPAGLGFYNFVMRFNGQRFETITRIVPLAGGVICLSDGCIGVGTRASGPRTASPLASSTDFPHYEAAV